MEKKFILLVEDDPGHALLTRRAFEKNGIGDRLRIARDGVEALEVLFNCPTLPCLVLLDLNMPRMDGAEALRRLRANLRTQDLPVVVLTSSNEAEDRDKALRWGVQGYVRKPVDFGEFVEIIRELGVYWLQMDAQSPPGKETKS